MTEETISAIPDIVLTAETEVNNTETTEKVAAEIGIEMEERISPRTTLEEINAREVQNEKHNFRIETSTREKKR